MSSPMNRGRRRGGNPSPDRTMLVVSPKAVLLISAVFSAVAAPAACGLETCAFIMPGASRSSGVHRHVRRRGAIRAIRAVDSRKGTNRSVEPGQDRGGGITIHDDSWHLGDGGFAQRHLEDEARIAAKEDEREFFRQRSLSVYDQMKEASMLLLAQQQILAAEEARTEASKPRFVAAAGGTMAARAQAARERQKRRDAGAGLLPDAPAVTATAGASSLSPTSSSVSSHSSSLNPSSSPEEGRAGGGGSSSSSSERSSAAVPFRVPVGPGSLTGHSLGVGGLDKELEEIRRRVCVPLAAPADLLEDLGISPVRGMLLYGPPGCGKTLLARRLSAALTPRPPAVVSGPEILERFVGSSEANIRALFDYPPDVPGGNEAEQAQALHVIVMDEFDSIGQRRGGGGDDGGDRVRDSVVNQLLARIDGFQELERPTLLVALTNRLDLLDTALLRPGRFEVQVHIPGPDEAGREAILRIHTQRMYQTGRIETPPPDPRKDSTGDGDGGDDDGYDTLVSSLAAVTDGFTGAELAGLVRAAASYALERAVSGGGGDGSSSSGGPSGPSNCRVTPEDFGHGLADVTRSKSSTDYPPAKANVEAVGAAAAADAAAAAVAATAAAAAPAAAVAGAAGAEEKEEVVDVASPVLVAISGEDEQRGGADTQVAGQQPEVPAAAPAAAADAKSSVSAAAVAAARFEGGIGGSLSMKDLESVQKLLLEKTSQREDEDVLLLDAAQLVGQRRTGGMRGGGGAGFSPGGGKRSEGATVPAAAAAAAEGAGDGGASAGDAEESAESEGQRQDQVGREDGDGDGGGDVASSANRPRHPQVATRTMMSALESEEDKCMYSFGVSLAIDADKFRKLLTLDERRTSLQGFCDHWLEAGMQLDHTLYADQVNELLQSRNEQLAEAMAAAAEKFIVDAAAEEGAIQTYSGMVVKTIREGTGAVPLKANTVKVHYHGTLIDGSVFDSSVSRGDPVSFPLDGVIEGWAEGLQRMKVGGISKFTIPPELAYGEEGSGPIPPDATLVFEVELLSIED